MPNVNPASPGTDLAGSTALADFNALSADRAEAELLTCCASRTFAREVAALRPYRDLDRLIEEADTAVRDLTWLEVEEALAAHPRIGRSPRAGGPLGQSPPVFGEPGGAGGAGGVDEAGGPSSPGVELSGRESSWSRQEQSGVDTAEQTVLDELTRGNLAYEQRFGHVYLICATGLSAEEMLARLRERLRNGDEVERGVVRAELAKIIRLRLAKLLGGAV